MPEAVSVRTHKVLIVLFIVIVIVTKFNRDRWTQMRIRLIVQIIDECSKAIQK
jgi:uncharacterized protein YggT (Ycf19 family)